MDIKYLIENRHFISKVKRNLDEIIKITRRKKMGFISFSFIPIVVTFFILLSSKLIQNNTFIDLFIVMISIILIFVVTYYIIKIVNKFKIKNKQLEYVFAQYSEGDFFIDKKTLKNIKEIFDNMTNDEKDFLSDKSNILYLKNSTSTMETYILNYMKNNELPEEEKEIINGLIVEYNLKLEQEELNKLKPKINKKIKKNIIKNNFIVKKI